MGSPGRTTAERAGRPGLNRRAAAVQVLALLPLWGSPVASAQRDGRGNRFDDDLIARLEGNWTLTRQIRGAESQNSVSATWVLQHQFLLLRMRDLASPSRYEADVYIGYSHATKEYVAHWIDNFGGHFSGVGRGRRSGNAVEFRFDYPDGPFFNTFSWDPASGTWSCHLESVAKDGTRQTFARDRLARAP